MGGEHLHIYNPNNTKLQTLNALEKCRWHTSHKKKCKYNSLYLFQKLRCFHKEIILFE